MKETLSRQIDTLFERESSTRPDALRLFVDKIHANYAEASRDVVKLAGVLATAWLVSYLIAAGFVREGAVSAFKVDRVSDLLIGAPVLIGLVGYGFFATLSATFVLWDALQASYRHVLPAAYDENLEFLLAPPTVTNIERLLNPSERSKPAKIAFIVSNIPTFALIFVGPFAALVHVSQLAWLASPANHEWTAACAIGGGVLLVKGFLLLTWALAMKTPSPRERRTPADPPLQPARDEPGPPTSTRV